MEEMEVNDNSTLNGDTSEERENASDSSPPVSTADEDTGCDQITCNECSRTESFVWRKVQEEGSGMQIVCNECAGRFKKVRNAGSSVKTRAFTSQNISTGVNREVSDVKDEGTDAIFECKEQSAEYVQNASLRKSVRSKRSAKVNSTVAKNNANKAKGRRQIFKQQPPIKSASNCAASMTRSWIIMDNVVYRAGDIVSLIDQEDNQTYFAQIRGFLQDEYCEKSAAITWLLPCTERAARSPFFIPNEFHIGPDEEIPRKMSCMQFVCHAPSDYYRPASEPFECLTSESNYRGNFVWASLEPTLITRH